jgi:hypothetical protein
LGESGSNVSQRSRNYNYIVKKTWYSRQAATERVQKLRVEYWEKIKDIEPENLVFLDETGIILGLTRTHARSQPGRRVTELKPFYRGALIYSYWRN